MAARGFDQIVLSLITAHPVIGQPARHGFMLNYPQAWARFYAEKRLERIDPVRQYIPYAEAAFTWASLPERMSLIPAQLDCLRLGMAAGLRDGIGIPLRGPCGALAGIGAASSKGGV